MHAGFFPKLNGGVVFQPGITQYMKQITADSVLLVFADAFCDETALIRDHDECKVLKHRKFLE